MSPPLCAGGPHHRARRAVAGPPRRVRYRLPLPRDVQHHRRLRAHRRHGGAERDRGRVPRRHLGRAAQRRRRRLGRGHERCVGRAGLHAHSPPPLTPFSLLPTPGGFGLVLDGSEDTGRRAQQMLLWDVTNGGCPSPSRGDALALTHCLLPRSGVTRRAWGRNDNAKLAIKRAMEANPKVGCPRARPPALVPTSDPSLTSYVCGAGSCASRWPKTPRRMCSTPPSAALQSRAVLFLAARIHGVRGKVPGWVAFGG